MTKVLVSALAAGALLLGAASPAFATGKIYGNYGQGPAPQNYGGPAYGAPAHGAPVYDQTYHAGPPAYAYRGDRDCTGESVAGTLIGGVLGGVIGSNLGRGHHHGWHGYRHSNRGPATVAGVLLGSFAGNAIASSACRQSAYAPAHGYGYGPQDAEPQYAGPQYDDGYGPGYDEDEYYDPDAPYDGR